MTQMTRPRSDATHSEVSKEYQLPAEFHLKHPPSQVQVGASKSAALHSPTVEQLARIAGVSRRTMFKAMKVQRYACAEVFDAARKGALSLDVAVEMLHFDHEGQRAILSHMHGIPAHGRMSFMRILLAGVQRCTEGAA